MRVSKKALSVVAIGVGLSAMLFAPVSQANWWWHRPWSRRWHSRVVRYRGCRRIVINRYCHINRWGYRQCYQVRNVRYICY